MRGFQERRADGGRTIVRSELVACLTAAGIADPPAMVGRLGARRRYSGRGRPALVHVPRRGGDPLPVVVRAYRRGGAFRRLLATTFFLGDRGRREVEALEAAAAAGVATARAVAAVRRRSWLVGYRAWLVTEEVPAARDLLERLRDRAAGDAFDPRPAIQAVGRALRRLHDAGVSLHDLHVKNVLVPDDHPDAPVLVDFDRARLTGRPLDESRRVSQLLRFDRSLEKAARAGARIARGERARLGHGYLGGTRLDAATRRRSLDAHRKHLARHVRIWKLTGR